MEAQESPVGGARNKRKEKTKILPTKTPPPKHRRVGEGTHPNHPPLLIWLGGSLSKKGGEKLRKISLHPTLPGKAVWAGIKNENKK